MPDRTPDDEQDRGGKPDDRDEEEAADPSLRPADDYEQQHRPDQDDVQR